MLILVHGCATEPELKPGLAELMKVGPQAAANREAQTRRYSEVSETELLAACVSVLQDQGFRITTSEARLGVITGIKPRSDKDILNELGRQLLLGTVTLGFHPDIQKGIPDSFRVVLVTRHIGGPSRSHEVRVTFSTWDIIGPRAPATPPTVITTPTLYQQFFGMLSATLLRTHTGN